MKIETLKDEEDDNHLVDIVTFNDGHIILMEWHLDKEEEMRVSVIGGTFRVRT